MRKKWACFSVVKKTFICHSKENREKMVKKWACFPVVKKTFICQSKENREKKTVKKSGRCLGKQRSLGLDSPTVENTSAIPATPPPPLEEAKLIEAENEQNRHAYSVAIATAVAAEAAVAAAQAAAEVVRLTAAAQSLGKTKEEIAAIKIQTTFRGYLARRALRALRGLVRLKLLIGGQYVKSQANSTLKCMQTLTHVQSEIRARRLKMSEANSAIQKQIQEKREKEIEELASSVGENWDDSIQSKEQVEANLRHRQEAAIRREKALAYAYSHQQTWRNSLNSTNHTFMDPNNPHWGWSWLERWMASRPWEDGTAFDKEPNSDRVSSKSTVSHSVSVQSRAPTRRSPSTPKSRTSKIRLQSPRRRVSNCTDEDSKSLNSVQSEQCRRHSIASSSVRDDESLASSHAVPRYMASTESARAKSRLPSPLGREKAETPENVSGSSAKKRLSFTGSPAGLRRHSEPPKVEIRTMRDLTANS